MLPNTWSVLHGETQQDYFVELKRFLAKERSQFSVYPPETLVFAALEATPYEAVKVLLLGQDPYHGEGQAHGLCFSVQPGVTIPPSLRNMYEEMEEDIGTKTVPHGYLMSWAEQGVLMLNTVLTVRANVANSHRKKGWEKFTDAVIRVVNEKQDPVVFVLWGSPAQKKQKLIDASRHTIVASAHPSPLSAYRGFFGSRPFSKINSALRKFNRHEIEWQLPLSLEGHH